MQTLSSMKTIRSMLGLAVLLAAPGCYEAAYSQNTLPQPVEVAGPPGGQMDPYGYAPATPAEAPTDPNPVPQGYADPNDPNYAMGAVTDVEIDATLQPYGEWVQDDDYGRVWRPYATTVGVDFTPYETAGSWAYTDLGWSYNCDWSWGWLPFHYGRWGWFDGYWGWVPGYQWGPAWVEWRHGGGYVGWRPLGPEVRDHRTIVRDHRGEAHESHWRFATETDFSRPNIRAHLFKNPAEGLRVTAPIRALPITATPVRAVDLMRPRAIDNPRFVSATPGVRPMHGQPGVVPMRPIAPPTAGVRAQAPTWRAPQPQIYRAPQQSYRPQPQVYRAPQQTYRPQPQVYRPQPTYRAPEYRQPTVYRAPQPTYRAPSPAPVRSYSAPSHSSSPPSRSYSAPSHSSSSSSSSSSGHSGGHHR
jgi:hypothetical protein